MSEREQHEAAERLVRSRLEAHGIGLEPLPDLPLGHAMLLPGGAMKLVKLLAREVPHRRGGGANLGLHWMLRSEFEQHRLEKMLEDGVWKLEESPGSSSEPRSSLKESR